jgi:hypothetical protein
MAETFCRCSSNPAPALFWLQSRTIPRGEILGRTLARLSTAERTAGVRGRKEQWFVRVRLLIYDIPATVVQPPGIIRGQSASATGLSVSANRLSIRCPLQLGVGN